MRTLVVNKAVLVQRHAALQVLRFAQEFGLTPAARVSVEGYPRATRGRYNPFAG